MKKNKNKGYFIMETIIVISLVATIMAYVYPNINAVYENYKYQATLYDQTEDVHLLNTIYQKKKELFTEKTTKDEINIPKLDDDNPSSVDSKRITIDNIIIDWFIIGYVDTKKIKVGGKYDPDFNRYVSRLHRQIFDNTSNRLVARIIRKDHNTKKVTYTSIKIVGNTLPEGYEQVRYVESKGTTYVDTKIPDNGWHAVFEYEFTETKDDTWIQIMGTHLDNVTTHGRSYIARTNNFNNYNNKIELASQNFALYSDESFTTNKKITIDASTFSKKLNFNQCKNCEQVDFEDADTFSGWNIPIFGVDIGNSTKHAVVTSPGRLYYAIFYDANGKAIKSFVPIKDKLGQCALYDLINGGEPYYGEGEELTCSSE